MGADGKGSIEGILADRDGELLSDWVGDLKGGAQRSGLMRDAELRDQCSEFLRLLREGVISADPDDIQGPAWGGLREMLSAISRTRGQQGFSPSETATFVFSLKRPLFDHLRRAYGQDGEALAAAIWSATALLDRLGLLTIEVHQRAREEVIARQQQELLELSTPVVKLWDRVLALPMIGTLDSERTQIVMESLLQKIVEEGSEIAIIDITGVPTVDTLVAQHLLKTVTAARLMGADCIISGIRPQIAQTIVHLGVDLAGVTTKATLADAFALAMKRTGLTIGRVAADRS